MGTFGSDEFSQSTKSSLCLLPAAALTHCPPMIGVTTTLALGWVLPHCSWPQGVSTDRVLIAFATAALSWGSVAALNAAAATSNRARLGPSCWFHCLPEELSYPFPRSAEETPVRDEVYGKVGVQYAPEARPTPMA